MNNQTVIGNERGGATVMVISLIVMIFCILVMVVGIDYILLYTKQSKVKNDLNAAVHAASLSIDEAELSKGFFRLDTTTANTRAQDMFYKYLRLNMKLGTTNKALPGSPIAQGTQVNIEELIYVDYESRTITNLNTLPTGCILNTSLVQVSCNVTLNGGSPTEITQVINQSIAGPSVVAIISATFKGIGNLNEEPLLLPAVQEVYFRK